jgi:predicted nucleotidyltransferase component of viral defense system
MALMADAAKSILDRLKIKSRTGGTDYQLLLQLFCQEEFLRRLGQSQYNHNFILKGGLLLYCISGFRSRPTQDIDFLLKNQSNAKESIQAVLEKIISINNEGSPVVFKINSLESIAEHREYNGIRAKVIAHIKNTRIPFDIDMGVGDVIVPKPVVQTIPTQLDGFDSPSIYAYSLESIVAEKFDAIISRLELTSRMKDFFDIYYLAISYSFDGRKLQEALNETLQNRGTYYDATTLGTISTFSENPAMLAKWNHFAKSVLKSELQFDKVIEVIVKFVGPVYNAIIHESELLKQWEPGTLRYIDHIGHS